MSKLKFPGKKEMNAIFSSFSKREWVFFTVFVLVFLITSLAMLEYFNKSLMEKVPLRGGTVREGVVGTPRFINPVLDSTLVDQDLTALIYSGLMRKKSDGTIMTDLAEKYEVDPSGLLYTFTLRQDAAFHDGEPVTADDVVFTINSIKDSIIKSPEKVNWDGVSVEKIDEKNIKFTLRQPYALFLENASVGILPEHIWNDSPIELNNANTNPIGSGPYMIKKVGKLDSGSIEYYELSPFKKYTQGVPYISKFVIRFYNNEDEMIEALTDDAIDQISSITPSNAITLKEKGYEIESSVLPRVFGLFFNQNQNQLFINKTVVSAIDKAIDKESIVREVLYGYGEVIDGPIPPNLAAYQNNAEPGNTARDQVLGEVRASLAKDGWTPDENGYLEKTVTDDKKKKTTTKLEFSISTGNTPELSRAAEIIERDLRLIGIKASVQTFDVGSLNQNIIRPRKYDALLFGEIINHESDLFAFWHSSQRKDPGLNVAMYTNAKVDKLLEDAFVTTSQEDKLAKYTSFEEEINKDMPAVFLYSPNFIYVVSKELSGLNIENILSPKDRFNNVYSWYTQTEDVWKIFVR